MIGITPHSEWINELLCSVKPYQERILSSRIFEAVTNDRLTKRLAQGAATDFYPMIESFPRYLRLNLAKVPAPKSEWNDKTRTWLKANIHQERLHAGWWRRMAGKFGVSSETLQRGIQPPPEIDAINTYLLKICTDGSLPEAVSAANFAVEGATGEWTKKVSAAFRRFPHLEDVELTEQDLEWITAHASYDDSHPREALEIIKAYATSDEDKRKVTVAAKRALEYYAQALEACYEAYG